MLSYLPVRDRIDASKIPGWEWGVVRCGYGEPLRESLVSGQILSFFRDCHTLLGHLLHDLFAQNPTRSPLRDSPEQVGSQ